MVTDALDVVACCWSLAQIGIHSIKVVPVAPAVFSGFAMIDLNFVGSPL